MRIALAASTLALVGALASTGAAAITITSTTPSWGNVQGGANIDFDTSGSGNNRVTQVFWGYATTWDGQSGLGFNPAQPPALNINPDQTFLLGTLTHYNNPISAGSAATSADLSLSTAVQNAVPTNQTFAYRFFIDETTNERPCAYPSTTPCADRITFSNLDTSNAFSINGVNYTIELLGFSTNGGNSIVSSFISQEGGSNSAGLYARITQASQVPEPTSLALIGLALAGMGVARRNRKAA